MRESNSDGFVSLCDRTELARDGVATFELGRSTLAVFDVAGRLYALDDACPHSGGPLSEGQVQEGTLTCPWHGARFDLASGRAVGEWQCPAVRVYAVREHGGRIEVAP
ncbi:MAG: Rieske 2Fe-2S domain-containing protein [Planctomycetes bacterium]|nr:Rieske 2Fe-2S domain-containing protein [Planctomycetota bacterium]